jgi:hypothetical protein
MPADWIYFSVTNTDNLSQFFRSSSRPTASFTLFQLDGTTLNPVQQQPGIAGCAVADEKVFGLKSSGSGAKLVAQSAFDVSVSVFEAPLLTPSGEPFPMPYRTSANYNSGYGYPDNNFFSQRQWLPLNYPFSSNNSLYASFANTATNPDGYFTTALQRLSTTDGSVMWTCISDDIPNSPYFIKDLETVLPASSSSFWRFPIINTFGIPGTAEFVGIGFDLFYDDSNSVKSDGSHCYFLATAIWTVEKLVYSDLTDDYTDERYLQPIYVPILVKLDNDTGEFVSAMYGSPLGSEAYPNTVALGSSIAFPYFSGWGSFAVTEETIFSSGFTYDNEPRGQRPGLGSPGFRTLSYILVPVPKEETVRGSRLLLEAVDQKKGLFFNDLLLNGFGSFFSNVEYSRVPEQDVYGWDFFIHPLAPFQRTKSSLIDSFEPQLGVRQDAWDYKMGSPLASSSGIVYFMYNSVSNGYYDYQYREVNQQFITINGVREYLCDNWMAGWDNANRKGFYTPYPTLKDTSYARGDQGDVFAPIGVFRRFDYWRDGLDGLGGAGFRFEPPDDVILRYSIEGQPLFGLGWGSAASQSVISGDSIYLLSSVISERYVAGDSSGLYSHEPSSFFNVLKQPMNLRRFDISEDSIDVKVARPIFDIPLVEVGRAAGLATSTPASWNVFFNQNVYTSSFVLPGVSGLRVESLDAFPVEVIESRSSGWKIGSL